MPSLIDEFCSGDRDRVYRAAWQVLRSRDPDELAPLVPALASIDKATEELDLGGALHSNRTSYHAAIRRIERFGNGECWCASYPDLKLFDPKREEADGHLRILATSTPRLRHDLRVRVHRLRPALRRDPG